MVRKGQAAPAALAAPADVPADADAAADAEPDTTQPPPAAAPAADVDTQPDAIAAEAAKAAARGTEMDGVCDEFKGKPVSECVAMQPPPKSFVVDMDSPTYTRKEKGILTFACVKGKYMMYGEQEHLLPNKTTLKMWDAYAPLPTKYLKPDEINPSTLVSCFEAVKTQAGKKHVVCV